MHWLTKRNTLLAGMVIIIVAYALVLMNERHLYLNGLGGIGGASVFGGTWSGTIHNGTPFVVTAAEITITETKPDGAVLYHGPYNCRFTAPLEPNDAALCSFPLAITLGHDGRIGWMIDRALATPAGFSAVAGELYADIASTADALSCAVQRLTALAHDPRHRAFDAICIGVPLVRYAD